jgi:RNA helicase
VGGERTSRSPPPRVGSNSNYNFQNGELVYATNRRVVSVCKWETVIYDNEWATSGLPYPDTASLPGSVKYICGQPEYNTTIDPTTGKRRQHFQGLVIFDRQLRQSEVGAALGIRAYHALPVGNDMVFKRRDYTMKEQSAVLDADGQSMWKEMGTVPDNMKRSGDQYRECIDMLKEGKTVMDVIEAKPQLGVQCFSAFRQIQTALQPHHDRCDLEVYYIYGGTGVGKSHFVRRGLVDGDNTEVYNKPAPASKFAVDWWLGYKGQTRVLFDDFHPRSYFPTLLLNYFQEYAMTVQDKGTHVSARWNRVYITTNVPIEEWYAELKTDPQSVGNVQALMRRIPERNRMHMVARPPVHMGKCTFAEMKEYQDSLPRPEGHQVLHRAEMMKTLKSLLSQLSPDDIRSLHQ